MVKKIFMFSLLFVLVSISVFSDPIEDDDVTWVVGYIKYLLIQPTTNYHYVYFDMERDIDTYYTSSYYATLTTASKQNAVFALNMYGDPGAKDVLAYLMLAKAYGWKVKIQVMSTTVINGINAMNYVLAPVD